mgnify:CR=1 FL=1
MIRDVFYYGNPPNAHPREKHATSLEDARRQSTTEHFWVINEFCIYTNFDWEWDFEFLPDAEVWAQEHNNVWPSQHQKDSGTWLCPKQRSDIIVYRNEEPIRRKNEINDCWQLLDTVDISNFDFSWHPDPTDPPYIYKWGCKYYPVELKHVLEYHAKGATQDKYMDEVVELLPEYDKWKDANSAKYPNFDFSWRPDPREPPWVYQFGTFTDMQDGPTYYTTGNDDTVVYTERIDKKPVPGSFPKYTIATTLNDLIRQHPNETFWALNPDLNYSNFDFNWHPTIEQAMYIHAFGSNDSIDTQTFFVNGEMVAKGYTDINYVNDVAVDISADLDIFYIDRGNSDANSRFAALKNRFPTIQKTRYLNSWIATINRCIKKATSKLCWIVDSQLDYSEFEFKFYPSTWQMKMVHVFGTQWSHWGTTFLINVATFSQDSKHFELIEHMPTLNFVKKYRAKALDCVHDVYVIDFGNKELADVVTSLTDRGIAPTVIPYKNSYFDTLKELVTTLPQKKEDQVWICSSICDYSTFDFTYICDPFAKTQLHTFPSNKQKYGDTFLVDINAFRAALIDIDTLQDYPKVNFNNTLRVTRKPAPIVISEDTHLSAVNNTFDFPYALFKTADNQHIAYTDSEPISVWDGKTMPIKICSAGGTQIMVPKNARTRIRKEFYDYPHIVTAAPLIKSMNMDVVFISNGEPDAEKRYELLKSRVKTAQWVNGVKGRENAIKKAVEIASTDWVLVVPGKIEIDSNFDLDWQPDRMQEAKHYIFYATNPVNNLCYGHMAPVMYNKRLVLETIEYGLDFTMSKPHAIVQQNAGVARFNLSPITTWRTAFREVVKLKVNAETDIYDFESVERLKTWLTTATGENGEYSLAGAAAGIDYYNEVSGDISKLQASFDWDWLDRRFTALNR